MFQESFTLKRFNSDGERNWKNITPWTRRKRKWKGTWPGAGKLMQETNALFKSLHVEDGALTCPTNEDKAWDMESPIRAHPIPLPS